MLACEANNGDEISYNSAISTCEKDQQGDKHDCFFDYDALEGDSEFVDPEGEAEGIRPVTPESRG